MIKEGVFLNVSIYMSNMQVKERHIVYLAKTSHMICEGDTLEDAERAIKRWELNNRYQGVFEPNNYEIVRMVYTEH